MNDCTVNLEDTTPSVYYHGTMSKKKAPEPSLPSVDSVLNKLKSDGTFDQFRRTCLGYIQGEPSFRSYSEHLEVVSRRYLQSYKWRDSSTKNEVRGKLRDHALGVIVSPDIQVGTPLIDIVEKVLESKAKELLPKISESVEFLCEARAKQLVEAQAAKEAQEAQETIILPITAPLVANTPKSDYVDLSLPIDLPGLNTPPPAKPVKPQGVAGKQENKPKAIKKGTIDPQKAKAKPLSGLKTVKDDSKLKSDSKEQKVIAEKEKPKVYRIPKKPKVDESIKEVKTIDASLSKENNSSIDGPKPLSKRRSTRLASQTDSKASSDNEHSDGEATPTRKRRRASGGTRARIHSSSEESEISSEDYESDTDQQSEGESPREQLKSSKISRHDGNKTSRKKPKQSKKMRLSKSPPMIVTRYNRSVKPNKRYYDACTVTEDDSQSTLEETTECSQGEDEPPPLTRTLDTTRPCDNGEMEIQDNAILAGDERVDIAYEMLKPKPRPLKVKKILLRGIRSRNRTNSRINFFQHR